MREPKRWKDPSGGADAETRAFLQNVPGGTPSHAEMDRMWTGIATQLEFVAKPIQSPPAGPAASTAGKATMAVVLVATIGAVVGVRAIHSRARHEPVPEALAAKPAFRATATVRARAFMHTYPSSPYRARIRALVFESE
jgi:hypothetical protein